jgi:hypothetical protein
MWKGKILALFGTDIVDKFLRRAEKTREIHSQGNWSGNRNLKKGLRRKARLTPTLP